MWSQVILASAFTNGRLSYPNFTPALPGNQLNVIKFLSALRQGTLLVVALPSSNVAMSSHSDLFCDSAVWLRAKTDMSNSVWVIHGVFWIQHMHFSWLLQKAAWGSTRAGNYAECYSVKQRHRRICQSSLESHWHFLPGLQLSAFLPSSQHGSIYFVNKTERAEVSHYVIPLSEGKCIQRQLQAPCEGSPFRKDSLTRLLAAPSSLV